MLEITDPERGDVALAGKVTWFDPERSRYCIVESCPGSGGSIDCGEAKDACAHWITVDKLVEAKAMGVQKNGNTFLLEPRPPPEGGGTELDHESGYQENRVKIEHIEKDVKQCEEGIAPSLGGKGESKLVQHERFATVELEKTELGVELTGRTVASKRRKMDTPGLPISPSDSAPVQRAARFEARPHQATAPLQLGSPPLRPKPGEVAQASRLPSSQVEGSHPSVQYGVGSESGKDTRLSAVIETPSAATRHRSQQQARLLPSVQLEDQSDPFSRYPIRGRQRRPTNPAFNSIESRVLEGVPSPKRPRVEGDVDQSVTVTMDADPFAGSRMGLACPKDTVVADPSMPSAYSEASNHESFRRTPQARCSTEAPTVSAMGVESCELGSTCDIKPGWPHGTKLLGQVPVMRVRTIHLLGGGEAAYFASAYSSVAKSVVFDKRSLTRLSFRFEELEQLRLTDRAKQTRQQSTNTDVLIKHSERSPGGARAGREGGENGHAAENETWEGDASPAPRVENLGQEQKEKLKDKREETTVGETSDVSSDGDSVEDGQIENGQADVVPAPRGSDQSIGDNGVERAPDNGVKGEEEGAGSNGLAAQTVGRSDINPRNISGDDGTNAEDVEDMDVSSDDVSCGGFEGAEAASPCISEDDDGFDMGWVTSLSPSADDSPNISLLGAGSAFPVPSPSTTETPHTLGEQFSADTGCAVEESESSVDELSEDSRPKHGNSTELVARAKNALPTTSGEDPKSGLQEDMSAESETEMVPQLTGVTLALRSIVREQLQGVLRSASKGGEAALAGERGNDVLERIASDAEEELFQRLYQDSTGGREYKVKYSVRYVHGLVVLVISLPSPFTWLVCSPVCAVPCRARVGVLLVREMLDGRT